MKEEVSLAEIFHENTNIFPCSLREQRANNHARRMPDYVNALRINQSLYNTARLSEIISSTSKNYREHRKYLLKKYKKSKKLKVLLTVMESRRSIREYSGEMLKPRELSIILEAGRRHPIKDKTKKVFKNIPSAGGLYPLEIYVALPSISNNETVRGLYHYDFSGRSLSLIEPNPNWKSLKEAINQPTIQLHKSSCVIFITGILKRLYWKYGNRSYRYMLFEAGHLAQNILLLSTCLNLGSCLVGGFVDNIVDANLHIDGVNEVALYIIVIGKKREV